MTPLVVLGPPSGDEAAGSVGARFGWLPRQPMTNEAGVTPTHTAMMAAQQVFVSMNVSKLGLSPC